MDDSRLEKNLTKPEKIYLVWYRAADAISVQAYLVGIFHKRDNAKKYGEQHYPGYGPKARDYFIVEEAFKDDK